MTTAHEYAKRAAMAIREHESWKDVPVPVEPNRTDTLNLADILTDLRHWCDAVYADADIGVGEATLAEWHWLEALDEATERYQSETTDPPEPTPTGADDGDRAEHDHRRGENQREREREQRRLADILENGAVG